MSANLKRKYEGEEQHNKKNTSEHSIEERISKLVNEVVAQGPLGNLVIILQDDNESPYVTLQNAISYMNMPLTVLRDENNQQHFQLQINGKEFARGTFNNAQLAKKPLAEEALEKLKSTCFSIHKKKNYVNVTKQNLEASTSGRPPAPQASVGTDSIAHKIMMKMGWTGRGLGAQEQGNLDSVMLYENVNRQGLGTSNLIKDITNKLESFSKSSNLLTLVFDSDFTKDERVLIHKVARKLNLKSKSTGSESRKLTVSKKITRIDIVKELLRIGGEDGLYKLHIPSKFAHLW